MQHNRARVCYQVEFQMDHSGLTLRTAVGSIPTGNRTGEQEGKRNIFKNVFKKNGQKAKYSVNCKLNKPKLSQIENALNDNDTSPMMKLSSLLQ